MHTSALVLPKILLSGKKTQPEGCALHFDLFDLLTTLLAEILVCCNSCAAVRTSLACLSSRSLLSSSGSLNNGLLYLSAALIAELSVLSKGSSAGLAVDLVLREASWS